MNVLSLFDGLSCARIALKRARIKVDNYYASEIDKYSQIVSRANFPDIIRLGDINGWESWDIEQPDLIISGFPCQGFSFAGKQLNFDDPRSALFFSCVEILNHYQPKYFLLENVKMKKEYQDIISRAVGVEPIEINSALVSAQNRKRLYWTNIPGIKQPRDKGILLKDIIEDGGVCREKSQTIPATIYKENAKSMLKRRKMGLVVGSGKSLCKQIGVADLTWRKLTPLECERLQTVPDNFTNHVSNTQRYKMLGNGFTVDVIAHILKHIKK